jgi:DNA-binding IclR family transcriptional regulator
MIPARWNRVLDVLPQPTIPAIAAAVGMTKPQASGIVHRMQTKGIMRKTDQWEVIK